MNNPQNAFFFETQPIPEDLVLFEELKKQELFFSYFQVDQKYYLFFYGQKFIDIDLIDPVIDIIEELDTKQRKMRSLRGFFLYALEILETANNYEILTTNLQPSFWRKLKTILRQNKKTVLLQFLFGRVYSYQGSTPHSDIIEMIQNLQTQVNSLQQKLIELKKNQRLNLKHALSGTRMYEKTFFETPIGNFKQKKTENVEALALSERSEQSNFLPLSQISEQERVEIIQTGFQLNQERKISLKNYYESTDQNSLFQSKGYSIKYESIRKNKLYKELKVEWEDD